MLYYENRPNTGHICCPIYQYMSITFSFFPPSLTKSTEGLILLIDSVPSSSASGLIGGEVDEKWPLGSFTSRPAAGSSGVKTGVLEALLFQETL